MDEMREQFHAGRRGMITAFVLVSDLARRAGVDEDSIDAAHGEFFDGNVSIKDAFEVVLFKAAVRLR
jgi:hypothetical protein